MKKILALLAFITVFSFVACKDDDYDFNIDGYTSYPYEDIYYRPSYQDVLGKYKSEDTIYDEFYTLNPDTTFSFVAYYNGNIVAQDSGKFKLYTEHSSYPSEIGFIQSIHNSKDISAYILNDSTFDTDNDTFKKIR
jgi:hypothetical protein